MQNSNPSQYPSPDPFLSCFPESMARAYARARRRLPEVDPSASEMCAAFGARTDEHADEKAESRTATEPRNDRERVNIDELIRVFREPIEWLLARAERRSQSDPADVAAIRRVRQAFRLRLTSILTGGVFGEARPQVRATDLLIVAGVLIDTIDPAVVQGAASSLGGGITETLATMLQRGPALATSLASAAVSFARPHAPHPVSPRDSNDVPQPPRPRGYCDHNPQTPFSL